MATQSRTLDSTPDIHKLLELLAGIKHLWHEIGLALGVPNAELEVLQQEHVDNIVRLSKVLQCWINQNKEVTWYSIITAVRSKIVGQIQVSQEIESYVLQGDVKQTYQITKEQQSRTLDSTPDIHKLLELLAGIKYLWYEIGLALGVRFAELEGLQHEHVDNIVRLSKVLQCWINQNKEVTWYSIITAVRSEIVGQIQVSQEIESYVLQGDVKQTYQITKEQQSSMGEEHVSTSLEILLDQQPSLLELTTHARTAQWKLLGVQLELDGVDLAGCTDLISMYQLWIEEKAEMATRRNLLTALRSIKQNNVARQYEDYLRTLAAEKEVTPETTKGVTNEHVTVPSDTKKIIFDKNKLIGNGSEGTCVYKGSFGSIDVAVKRVVSEQFNDLVKREIDILQEHDWHPNIVRCYGVEEDIGYVNIALELCQCTLFEFVDGSELQHANGKDLLFGAMKGVDHLHNFNIIHRDLKPQNVLLKLTPSNEVMPLISDFGLCRKLADGRSQMTTKYGMAGTLGWIAPEMSEDKSKVTQAVDIFAMGCIIYYVLSHGRHPFGRGEHPFDPMNSQVRIRKKKDGKVTLSDLEGEDKFIVENLVRAMIKSNHESRPSSREVLAHCLFWSKEKQLKFFQQVSDWIQWALTKQPTGSTTVDNLEVGVEKVFKDEWLDGIDEELKQDLIKYKGKLLRELLRAIRNKSHHYYELPESLKTKLGSVSEGFVTYFTSRFPYLLIHTYNVMKEEPNFKERHPDFFKT